MLSLFLVAALQGGATRAPAPEPGPEPARSRPDVVIVLSDDSGWSDLGCYGGELSTPNIDALAADGLRFRSFYTNARCSPSRASLLTGLWPHEVGVGDLCMPQKSTDLPGYTGNMDSSRTTLAELLRDAGYRTALSGKWHLGGWGEEPEARRFWPTARGFERYWGMLTSGQSDYFAPTARYRLDDEDWEAPEGFYATTATTDFALRFLDDMARDGEAPFFLLVSYSAPHFPEQALPEDLEATRPLYEASSVREVFDARARRAVELGIVPETWTYAAPAVEHKRMESEADWRTSMATKAAMLRSVDRGVGQIVARLGELGRLDDTILLYLSDNGAAGPHAAWGNAPFTGAKGDLDEGGLLTHCIVHWPDGLATGVDPGAITAARAHVVDLLPTLTELCGVELPEPAATGIAGESFAELLRRGVWHRSLPMFWDLYGQQAMVDGRWKLHVARGAEQLFDLDADGTARSDVAHAHPERVAEMRAAWSAWAKRVGVAPQAEVVAAQRSNGYPAPRRSDGDD